MEYSTLGNTGIEVSRLCIGTLTMSPMQRNLEIETGARVILEALAKGVNFIDTAQMYGSYAQVKRALVQWNGDRPVIASKSTARSAQDMSNSLSECLENTGCDFIDVFLLHAVRDAEDLASRSGAIECLLQARQNGIVKAIGASSHSALTIDLLAKQDFIEVLHAMYNRDGIGILDASLEKMTEILGAAKKAGKGIYAMKPLGGGHLVKDAADALRWIFASQVVDSVAVGMTSSKEVEMNVCLANGKDIASDFASQVAGQQRKLFINHMICKKCGACVSACQQGALHQAADGSVAVIHEECVLCGYCAPSCPVFAVRII